MIQLCMTAYTGKLKSKAVLLAEIEYFNIWTYYNFRRVIDFIGLVNKLRSQKCKLKATQYKGVINSSLSEKEGNIGHKGGNRVS